MKLLVLKGKNIKIVAAACILILLFTIMASVISKSVSTNQAIQKEAPQMIEITEKVLADLISEGISNWFPLKNVSATIAKDGLISLSSDISSKALMKLLEENNVPLSRGMKLMIRLLPETVKANMEIKLIVDPETAQFGASIENFVINGLDISGSLIPPKFTEGITSAINNYLTTQNLRIGTVEVGEGKILITPALP